MIPPPRAHGLQAGWSRALLAPEAAAAPCLPLLLSATAKERAAALVSLSTEIATSIETISLGAVRAAEGVTSHAAEAILRRKVRRHATTT